MYSTYQITYQQPSFLNAKLSASTAGLNAARQTVRPSILDAKNSSQLMSSLEIAQLTGKRHDNVLRDIQKLADELSLSFEEKSQGSLGGRPTKVLMLDKRNCLILIAGYSIIMRATIIDRWQVLEATHAIVIPQTYGEALKAAAEAEMAREALALESQRRGELLALATPKVDAYDQLMETEGLYVPKQIAAMFPERKLDARKVNQLLKDWGWQVKQGKRWHANQLSINNGWQVSKVFTTEKGFSGSQLHVTNAGLEEIQRRLKEVEPKK